MVEDRVTNGRRIAQLLASELDGREDRGLGRVEIRNADPDIEPTIDGAFAYDVTVEEAPIAAVFLQPDRVRLDIQETPDRTLEVAADHGLWARPGGGDPPRTLVFVESGAAVKDATRVIGSIVDEPTGHRSTDHD